MNKINYQKVFGIGLFSLVLLGLGYLLGSVYPVKVSMMGGFEKSHEISILMDSMVMNSKGEELGKVHDFVIDSNGQVQLAVISHNDKTIAVPFGMFHFGEKGEQVVLDMNRERLDTAPAYSGNLLDNEKWVEDNYRHFGLQPLWMEPTEKKEDGYEIPWP